MNGIYSYLDAVLQVFIQPIEIGRKTSKHLLVTFAILVLLFSPLYYWLLTSVWPQPAESLLYRVGCMVLVVPYLLPQFHRMRSTTLGRAYVGLVAICVLPLGITYMHALNGGSQLWSACMIAMLFIIHGIMDWRLGSVVLALSVAFVELLVKGGLVVPVVEPTHVERMEFWGIFLFAWVCSAVLEATRSSARRERMVAALTTMGTVAHEFRTPLAAAAVLNEAIARYAGSMEPSKGARIEKLTEKLDSIFHGLQSNIDYQIANARMTKDKGVQSTCVRIADLIREVINHYPEMVGNERSIITTEMDPDCYAYVREVQFSQVIANLLSNSFKALTARGGRYKEGDIHISVSKDSSGSDSWMAIKVRDRGIGIRAEDKRRLFSGFFTTSPGSRNGLPTHGMGLRMCKSVVKALGGKIDCDSEYGHGATMIIHLQRVEAAEFGKTIDGDPVGTDWAGFAG